MIILTTHPKMNLEALRNQENPAMGQQGHGVHVFPGVLQETGWKGRSKKICIYSDSLVYLKNLHDVSE